MTLAKYIVKKMEQSGVTDAFGIPGSVILNLIYELDQSAQINIHLNYHEQTAAYAACGYAQRSQRLGIAYATKGPGITNMITSIADAYYDSLPTLFITAHSKSGSNEKMRIETDQELNIVPMVKNITKYATKIEDIETAKECIDQAFFIAQNKRKGPVLLDILSSLFQQELEKQSELKIRQYYDADAYLDSNYILESLNKSERPVLLLGDGIKQSGMSEHVKQLANRYHIPVLSSRCAQDIMPNDDMYFGYIGSHATRYSNFILAKADLIVALGNRMAYPVTSKSFCAALENSKIIRVDIDEGEFERVVPNCKNMRTDLTQLIPQMLQSDVKWKGNNNWISVCREIRKCLDDSDVDLPVKVISKLLKTQTKEITIVCDIGNNELWVSRAYAYSKMENRLIHSKSYKTVGCAIGKAIGVHYATKAPVVCFVGDQGFQFNIQELEYISQHDLPILIVICNNESSGMLRTSEKRYGYHHYVHTDLNSGYANPNFCAIARAYKMEYKVICVQGDKNIEIGGMRSGILELRINHENEVTQYLPKGNPCQKFMPGIDPKLYEYLEQL